jgi:putative nucleotidyltransferase with HDIG domain
VTRITLTRIGIFTFTTVAAWAILSFGGSGTSGLEEGNIASRNYNARSERTLENRAATLEAQDAARLAVEDQYRLEPNAREEAFTELQELITAVRVGAIDETAPVPLLVVPDVVAVEETTTTASEEGTSTTIATTVEVAGRVTIDVNGDGSVSADDQGLSGIEVRLFDQAGQELLATETQADGTWRAQAPETVFFASVNGEDPDFPLGFTLLSEASLVALDCDGGSCQSPEVSYRPATRPHLDQIADLEEGFPGISTEALGTLVDYATLDIVRNALNQESVLDDISSAAQDRLVEELRGQITTGNLTDTRREIASSAPPVNVDGNIDIPAGNAAAALVNFALRANYVFDPTATENAREAAAGAVERVMVTIRQGERIVDEGTPLSEFHVDAIEATGAASGRPGQEAGLLSVLAVLIGALGFYLARFRPEFWTRPRMAALLGLLIVVAAVAVRLTVTLQESVQDPSAWYALPGVVFGLMAAVLFDSRIAVLMAVAVAVLAATATRDPGVATYALFSTMIPVGFVSSLSTRGSYRKAVLASAVVVAGIAAAVAWFFHTNQGQDPWNTMLQSAGWALGVSLLTALLGLAALQFFESAFDITTSLTLLEFTDRNHEALLLLQEKAFGTFNHSLMVGTLADAAARAIGANPLLARAAAYYHDLGKTENPSYFIENQFGAANPHDELSPRQSVEIIRKHVTDGVELARKFRIPSEVAEAIVTHHGDGIMRFFYEKARLLEGNDALDPDEFRHIGHKPRSAETAIVMLADSLEAACRAVFADEEPTPQAIEKVVARVVDEKMNDGQLSDSSLTLGQLSRARSAYFEALVGHYHQRIAYPNFPGS